MDFKVVDVPRAKRIKSSQILLVLEKLPAGKAMMIEGLHSKIAGRSRTQFTQKIWKQHHPKSNVVSTLRKEGTTFNLYLWIEEGE